MELAIFFLIIILLAAASALSLKKRVRSIGRPDSLFSATLNENRKLWVCLPRLDEDHPEKRYPVVYLLDAQEQFASFTTKIQEVNELDGSRKFPDMIVIGIPNSNRSRDLTPTSSPFNAEGKKVSEFKRSGGGENFITFIEKELIPYIESKYPVTSNRTLIGHSLGGLFTINVLLNHTEVFTSYVASDPSIWWDDQLIIKQTRTALKKKRFDGRSLFISIANTVAPGVGLDQLRTVDTSKTNHVRSILQMADLLESHPDNGLNFSYKYYPTDDHNSVPAATWEDALRFLLEIEVS